MSRHADFIKSLPCVCAPRHNSEPAPARDEKIRLGRGYPSMRAYLALLQSPGFQRGAAKVRDQLVEAGDGAPERRG
jgi:hypothetical protein